MLRKYYYRYVFDIKCDPASTHCWVKYNKWIHPRLSELNQSIMTHYIWFVWARKNKNPMMGGNNRQMRHEFCHHGTTYDEPGT